MTYSNRLLRAAALCCAISAAACSESTTGDEPDMGGITFDAGPDLGTPDLGADLGPLPVEGNVGAPCEADADCTADAQCIPAPNFPGGYCTIDCVDVDCPSGSSCTPVDDRGTMICLDECDPAATGRECRVGYGCAETMIGPAICIPGCTDSTDCPSGTECDTSGGGGQCYSPEASIGDACEDESMCPAGGFCFAEGFAGWPGGACTQFGCDAADGTGCPDDATCVQGRRGGLCFADCVVDADCRAGYRCAENSARAGSKYCGPILATADIGQACSGMDTVPCVGGSCLREIDTGYPGSYCAQNGCAIGTTPSGCPGDTLCVADGTVNRCLDACTADADCRDGYDCTAVDAADPTSLMYCKPACTMDVQCVNDGATCTVATGLCAAPPPAP